MATKAEIKAKADEIREWFANKCDPNIFEHRAAVKRAAEMIFSRQTDQEKTSEQTIELNGRGFNGRDADFGSRIARWRGDLTVKMANGAKGMMKKYARQLAEIKLGMR